MFERWQNVIVKLPNTDGLRQIVVKVIKTIHTYSGIAIDDLTIRSCPDLSKDTILFCLSTAMCNKVTFIRMHVVVIKDTIHDNDQS